MAFSSLTCTSLSRLSADSRWPKLRSKIQQPSSRGSRSAEALLPVGPASLPRKAQPGNRRPKLLWRVLRNSPQPASLLARDSSPQTGTDRTGTDKKGGGGGSAGSDPDPVVLPVAHCASAPRLTETLRVGERPPQGMPRAHEIWAGGREQKKKKENAGLKMAACLEGNVTIWGRGCRGQAVPE